MEARGNADGLDDEHVVALEQRERGALGAEQHRRPLREHVRDLGRGGGAGEIRAQLLEGADVPQRALGLERSLGRALPSETQGPRDDDDQGRDGEIDPQRPMSSALPSSKEPRGSTRSTSDAVQPDDEAQRGRADAAVPGAQKHRAGDRRIDRVRAEREQRRRREAADSRRDAARAP